jgi:glycosyltransferase involved in cell wall biosynthesis
MNKEWEEANKWEEAWWGDCSNTADEEAKQVYYAEQMGIPRWNSNAVATLYDLGGKSILDVGGGPVSLLLKTRNRDRSVVVDPAKYPDWTMARYKAANIEYVQVRAEDMEFDEKFDEVWMYNVLQHVEDPSKIIQKIKQIGIKVRVFEWIETGLAKGHIHNLTQEFLEAEFGVRGKVVTAPWNSPQYPGKAWVAIYPENNKYRFHLLAIPHTQTTKEWLMCAYTQKVLKMADMLQELGHEVIHYGAEGSQVPCEHVTVITRKQQIDCYGDYDWKKEFFKFDDTDIVYKTFEKNAIIEINKRKRDGDYLLIPFGSWQRAIDDGTKVTFPVEMGIGYAGIYAKYKVFESYAWMHHMYGYYKQDASWYDVVIPNYFDPDDFTYSEKKGDYLLYMGRLTGKKGVAIALQVAKEAGMKLILAGQGNPDEFNIKDYPNAEYVGTADVKKRAELMSGARALLVPTTYIEPFGGVSIEANFCGTPVITTDWGCFAENVLDQVTGYRCRTFGEFVWAVKNADKLNPADCRKWAMENFTIARIKNMYQAYFDQLQDLYGNGWYSSRTTGISKYGRFERMYP